MRAGSARSCGGQVGEQVPANIAASPSAAVAPAGSPSTPLGLTARTDDRAQHGSSSAIGPRVAGLGPVQPHPVRGEGELERRLGTARVGVAGPVRPATPARRGTRRAAAASARRTVSALPPWVDTSRTRRKVRVADRPSSTSTSSRAPPGRWTGSRRSPGARRWSRRPAPGRTTHGTAPGPAGHRGPPRGRCRWSAAGAGRAARSSPPERPAPRRPRPARPPPARSARLAPRRQSESELALGRVAGGHRIEHDDLGRAGHLARQPRVERGQRRPRPCAASASRLAHFSTMISRSSACWSA